MSFIKPDENIIILDYPDVEWGAFNAHEVRALRDAGIQTMFSNLHWHRWSKDFGPGDPWAMTDDFVDKTAQAGMKGLIVLPDTVPTDCPPEWYCQNKEGKLANTPYLLMWDHLSPWNLDAQTAISALYSQAIARYKGTQICFIRGTAHGGEALMPYTEPYYYDPAARESFRDYAQLRFGGDLDAYRRATETHFVSWEQVEPQSMFHLNPDFRAPYAVTLDWLRMSLLAQAVRQQTELAEMTHETVWSLLSPCWRDHVCSGNFITHDLYAAMRERVRPEAIYSINFQIYPYGNAEFFIGLCQEDKARYGVEAFVGSQYCEGLDDNTDRAIREGFRGFVTGPIHQDRHGEQRLQPWMLAAIERSMAKWQAAE